jgi:uncharacterized SAM-binding protein YcdF (DUF218 family)
VALQKRCLILRRSLFTIAVLAVIGMAGAWIARDTVLRAAASYWIVSDPPESSDAVAVFGGGLETRPFAAAQYYRHGLVKRVLLSNVRPSRAETLGIEMSYVEANRQVLLKLGVPDSAIELFGDNVTNTRQEALALHQWAVAAGAHSIIVPTDLFSSRRLAWMLHRAFGDDAVIRVVALDPLEYNRETWWQSEAGVVAFQNEFIKYLYYRANY